MTTNREKKIYRILCDTFGDDAVNFFLNIVGNSILDTDEMEHAVIDNGYADAYEFTEEEETFEEENEY